MKKTFRIIKFKKNKPVLQIKAVSKSFEGGKHYFGIPEDDFRSKYKEIASIRKIPEILEKLKDK